MMILGGMGKCPYCQHRQEVEADLHIIATCEKCDKHFHAYTRIQVVTEPLIGDCEEE